MTTQVMGRAAAADTGARVRANFIHLVFDITAFGVLNGSAIAFVQVFAARQGATDQQLGLLTALPAMVTLVLALPAGTWLIPRELTRVTVVNSFIYRLFYLAWAALPLFLPPALQVRGLMLLVLLMSIPGTLLAIGFNGLYASAIPPDRRGQVMTWRQTSYAISSIVTSLACGALLDRVPFPQGYQVVFFIGFLAGIWSSLHLAQIRPLVPSPQDVAPMNDWAQPGTNRPVQTPRTVIAARAFLRVRQLLNPLNWARYLPLDRLGGDFGAVLALLFFFHLAQYLPIPLFPLRYVNDLRLTDGQIGVGHALFYASLFLMATRYAQIEARFGPARTLSLGVALMAFYPLWIAIADGVGLFFVANVFGGAGVALNMGAAGNYLLSRIPDDDRAPHLALYNMALNAAILLGAVAGPAIAGVIGVTATLIVAFVLRLLASRLLWVRG